MFICECLCFEGCKCPFIGLYRRKYSSSHMNHEGLWSAESCTKIYDIGFEVCVHRYVKFTPHDQIILEDIGGNIILHNVDTKGFDHIRDNLNWILLKNTKSESCHRNSSSVIEEESIEMCNKLNVATMVIISLLDLSIEI